MRRFAVLVISLTPPEMYLRERRSNVALKQPAEPLSHHITDLFSRRCGWHVDQPSVSSRRARRLLSPRDETRVSTRPRDIATRNLALHLGLDTVAGLRKSDDHYNRHCCGTRGVANKQGRGHAFGRISSSLIWALPGRCMAAAACRP